jgi:hypothetical protein
MGLKGYRLWVMGQLDSNVQSPTLSVPLTHSIRDCIIARRSVENVTVLIRSVW